MYADYRLNEHGHGGVHDLTKSFRFHGCGREHHHLPTALELCGYEVERGVDFLRGDRVILDPEHDDTIGAAERRDDGCGHYYVDVLAAPPGEEVAFQIKFDGR